MGLPDVTLAGLLWCAPTLPVQLTLLLVQAVFWHLAIKALVRSVIRPFLDAHPNCQQYTRLTQSVLEKDFKITLPLEKALDMGSAFIAVTFQHGVGGALCIPALLPALGIPWEVCAALARHGALCEAGFDLQDTLIRFWAVAFGSQESRELNPPRFMAMMLVHHTMSLSLVVPMNLRYADNHWYFLLVFMLQFTALVAMGAQQYGYLLDVRTPSGLRSMKLLSVVTAASTLYSRFLGYWYVVAKLLLHFWRTSGAFFAVGTVASLLMGGLNVLFVADSLSKCGKYLRMRLDVDSTRTDVGQSPKCVAKPGAKAALMAAALRERSRSVPLGVAC